VQRLDRTTRVSLVLNPFLSIDDLLRRVLTDFGAVSPVEARSEAFARATLSDLTGTLARVLNSLEPEGRAVLILDEAQHLSPRVLEEIGLVAGLERDGPPRLHVVLAGQPALLDLLAASDRRQPDQRISLTMRLVPLGRADVGPYIAHRLTVAGDSVSVAFAPSAAKRVHALSGGVPRVINLLCDRALMAGAARAVHDITPDLVDRAAEAMAFRHPSGASPRRVTRRFAWVALPAALLSVGPIGALQAPLHHLVETARPALPATPPVALPEPLEAPGVPEGASPE
jgi:general secretion pathway protein A